MIPLSSPYANVRPCKRCSRPTSYPEGTCQACAVGQDGAVMLTPRVAAHVLWMYGDPRGHAPDLFTDQLISAIAHAGERDRARLRAGFPAYVAAVELVEQGRAIVLHAAARGTAN